MPIKFKETKKIPSDNKGELLNYMVSDIELDDENRKMTVKIRDSKSFCHLENLIERLYKDAGLEQIKIPYKTSLNKKSNHIRFEKDLVGALAYLKSHKALSQDLHDEIVKHLTNLTNSNTPSTSLS